MNLRKRFDLARQTATPLELWLCTLHLLICYVGKVLRPFRPPLPYPLSFAARIVLTAIGLQLWLPHHPLAIPTAIGSSAIIHYIIQLLVRGRPTRVERGIQ